MPDPYITSLHHIMKEQNEERKKKSLKLKRSFILQQQ